MSFEIEKNIPIPTGKRRWGIYPFKKMNIGDSFYVETDHVGPVKTAASQAKSRHGILCSTHVCDKGIRVWRIA